MRQLHGLPPGYAAFSGAHTLDWPELTCPFPPGPTLPIASLLPAAAAQDGGQDAQDHAARAQRLANARAKRAVMDIELLANMAKDGCLACYIIDGTLVTADKHLTGGCWRLQGRCYQCAGTGHGVKACPSRFWFPRDVVCFYCGLPQTVQPIAGQHVWLHTEGEFGDLAGCRHKYLFHVASYLWRRNAFPDFPAPLRDDEPCRDRLCSLWLQRSAHGIPNGALELVKHAQARLRPNMPAA